MIIITIPGYGVLNDILVGFLIITVVGLTGSRSCSGEDFAGGGIGRLRLGLADT